MSSTALLQHLLTLFLLLGTLLALARPQLVTFDTTEPTPYQPSYDSEHYPAGCDYEAKVLKARAIVDVLSNQAAAASGGSSAEAGDGSLGIIGPYSIYDERFKWMRPFEFYECGQGGGQEF